MSNMIRKYQRKSCFDNGVPYVPKNATQGKVRGRKRAGYSLRSNPDFNQNSFASALMIVAGMAAMKHRPQKVA